MGARAANPSSPIPPSPHLNRRVLWVNSSRSTRRIGLKVAPSRKGRRAADRARSAKATAAARAASKAAARRRGDIVCVRRDVGGARRRARRRSTLETAPDHLRPPFNPPADALRVCGLHDGLKRGQGGAVAAGGETATRAGAESGPPPPARAEPRKNGASRGWAATCRS